MKDEGKLQEVGNEDKLFEHISSLIEESRRHIVKAVNTAMVYTYYSVGQYIVDFEQNGDYRAAYGKGVLNRLSTKLTGLFGKGWSVDTQENCRKFFQVYSISSDDQTKPETLSRKSDNRLSFTLSWSRYLILLRIDNPDARSFYENGLQSLKKDRSIKSKEYDRKAT